MEVFTAPLWSGLEEQAVRFVQSRAELKEQDPAFLEIACRQLIPRGRGNGLFSANDIVRYVYLSLLADYKASGADVCQRMSIPYSSQALRAAEQSIGAEAQAASQAIDQAFSRGPVSPVVTCAVEGSGSAAQQAVADSRLMAQGDKPADPCAPLRAALVKAQEEVASAEGRARDYAGRGDAEIVAAEAEFGRLGDLASRDRLEATKQRVRLGRDAGRAAVATARKGERAAVQALTDCETTVAPPQAPAPDVPQQA
jgi:hypothetical protein